MKIVWILNSPIGEISTALGLNHSQSGSWIDAAMESLLEQTEDIRLTVVTTASISSRVEKTIEKVNYICLPAGRMLRGKKMLQKQLAMFLKEIREICPDIIHIWGTEFSFGYDMQKKIHDIPFVYTMQGVMSYICKYPYLYLEEMRNKISLFSKLRCLKYQKERYLQKQQAKLEQKMLVDADAVIADNEWAISHFHSNQNAETFHLIRLPIKKQFLTAEWNCSETEPNTVFCIAGRTGLKGIHQAIKAINILKQDFPDIKLLIPGNIKSRNPAWLFSPPYLEYLKNLIKEYQLEENISFLGQLTTEEMIFHMKRSQVFIMPSAIENESSTLREAMFLGMPIVTSFAGDIYETIIHGENGLLYRFEEYEMLAYFVRKLLKEPKYATAMGQQAKQTIAKIYENHNYGKSLSRIYHQIKR